MYLPDPSLVGLYPRKADDCSAVHIHRGRLIPVLFLLILPFLFLSPTASAQPSKRVLVLTGSDPNHPGFSVITRNIAATLKANFQTRVELVYELQDEFLKPQSPDGDQELIDYLKRKYQAHNVDVILALVSPRLPLLMEKDPALFANVPMVFYDFDSEREATNRILKSNVTAVWASLDLYKTLDLALTLHPRTRKVIVVSG